MLEGGADAFKDDRLSGAPPAAGQPAGVLMASPRTVSGRASADRGRGRSQRASCGGGRLTGCCRDSDRPHAPRPGPPAAAAHHRQSGDPDPASRRSSCAVSSTRSAAPRVRPSSPRARHQPELATERPNNGAITNPCCAVIWPLRRPQVLHRKRTPLPRTPPHPLASGQVVRSAQCGPLALIVEGTRRRRRASTTVRSGRSGKINSAGTNAQRGRHAHAVDSCFHLEASNFAQRWPERRQRKPEKATRCWTPVGVDRSL